MRCRIVVAAGLVAFSATGAQGARQGARVVRLCRQGKCGQSNAPTPPWRTAKPLAARSAYACRSENGAQFPCHAVTNRVVTCAILCTYSFEAARAKLVWLKLTVKIFAMPSAQPFVAADRITIDPDVCNGRPVVRGMRITVESILDYLSAGETPETILRQYPLLEPEDISACLAFASRLMSRRYSVKETA